MAPKVLLILSGKGGVGKSSVTTQTALTLTLRGHNVGVLDLDLTGPNLPRFFGIETQKVTQSASGLVPVSVHPRHVSGSQQIGALHVMSLGFILDSRSTAVIWRGPKKTAMVRQFLTQTAWPEGLDYLLVDTPPGTSDEHIALLETLLASTTAAPGAEKAAGELAGAIVVTTPQAVAVSDVRKELTFCRKTNTRVLGVIENMAGFICPHCAECTHIFSKGGGEIMAGEFEVPFLGLVPLDPMFGELIEQGTRPQYPEGTKGMIAGEGAQSVVLEGSGLAEKYTSSELSGVFDRIVGTILTSIS